MAESPVNLECKVKDIITLGDKGGAGHLIICEILHISIDESVITDGALDQQKLDLMGRLGKNYYVRASGDALMEISQVVSKIPIGFDGLPKSITESTVLTGNDIAILASLYELPANEKMNEYRKRHLEFHRISIEEKHLLAQELIRSHQAEEALLLLLA